MKEKILIVDDSAATRQMVGMALEPLSHELVFARDGVEALARMGEFPEIGLVVCDVQMPRMGGVEFLRVLRGQRPTCSVRVIMLTTAASGELVCQAAENGATVWVLKPFQPDSLLATVRRLMS